MDHHTADPPDLSYRGHQTQVTRLSGGQRIQIPTGNPCVILVLDLDRFDQRAVTKTAHPVPTQGSHGAKPGRPKAGIRYQDRALILRNDGFQHLQKLLLRSRGSQCLARETPYRAQARCAHPQAPRRAIDTTTGLPLDPTSRSRSMAACRVITIVPCRRTHECARHADVGCSADDRTPSVVRVRASHPARSVQRPSRSGGARSASASTDRSKTRDRNACIVPKELERHFCNNWLARMGQRPSFGFVALKTAPCAHFYPPQGNVTC